MEQNIFEEIGLSKNESKVYEVMVKEAKLSANEISAKAEVPYGKIYVVLEKLIQKGLVHVIPEKTKKYSSTSPEKLNKLIDEKENKLKKAKEKIKELKQFYEDAEEDVIKIGYGEKGFWQIADLMKISDKFLYNIRWRPSFNRDSISRIKRRAKEGLDERNLIRYDRDTKKEVDKYVKSLKKIKKIENNGVAFSVTNKGEVFIGLIKKNVSILIRDENLAEVMKKMYEAFYDKSEFIELEKKK